ncbi:MAG: hypothetical protein ABJ327_25420 [Litoreibacter sp.]
MTKTPSIMSPNLSVKLFGKAYFMRLIFISTITLGLGTIFTYSPLGGAIAFFAMLTFVGLPLTFLIAAIPTLFAALLFASFTYFASLTLFGNRLVSAAASLFCIHMVFIGYPNSENARMERDFENLTQADFKLKDISFPNVKVFGDTTEFSRRLERCEQLCEELLLKKSIDTYVAVNIGMGLPKNYGFRIETRETCDPSVTARAYQTRSLLQLLELEGQCIVRIPAPHQLDLLWEESKVDTSPDDFDGVKRSHLWHFPNGEPELLFKNTSGIIRKLHVPIGLVNFPNFEISTTLRPGFSRSWNNRKIDGLTLKYNSSDDLIIEKEAVIAVVLGISQTDSIKQLTPEERQEAQRKRRFKECNDLTDRLRKETKEILEQGAPYVPADLEIINSFGSEYCRFKPEQADKDLFVQMFFDESLGFNFGINRLAVRGAQDNPILMTKMVAKLMERFHSIYLNGAMPRDNLERNGLSLVTRLLAEFPPEAITPYLSEIGPLIEDPQLTIGTEKLVEILSAQNQKALPYFRNSLGPLIQKQRTDSLDQNDKKYLLALIMGFHILAPFAGEDAEAIGNSLIPFVVPDGTPTWQRALKVISLLGVEPGELRANRKLFSRKNRKKFDSFFEE